MLAILDHQGIGKLNDLLKVTSQIDKYPSPLHWWSHSSSFQYSSMLLVIQTQVISTKLQGHIRAESKNLTGRGFQGPQSLDLWARPPPENAVVCHGDSTGKSGNQECHKQAFKGCVWDGIYRPLPKIKGVMEQYWAKKTPSPQQLQSMLRRGLWQWESEREAVCRKEAN